jgi:hypothetical protein
MWSRRLKVCYPEAGEGRAGADGLGSDREKCPGAGGERGVYWGLPGPD